MAIQDKERERFLAALRREFGAGAYTLSLDGLLAHAAALRKDAERYRWLRLQCNTKTNLVQYRHGRAEYLYTCNSDDDMDDAIDRGRAVGAA